jgi:hypothetical protein
MVKTTQKAVEINLKSRSNKMEVAEGDRAKQSPMSWALNLNSRVNMSILGGIAVKVTHCLIKSHRVL